MFLKFHANAEYKGVATKRVATHCCQFTNFFAALNDFSDASSGDFSWKKNNLKTISLVDAALHPKTAKFHTNEAVGQYKNTAPRPHRQFSQKCFGGLMLLCANIAALPTFRL